MYLSLLRVGTAVLSFHVSLGLKQPPDSKPSLAVQIAPENTITGGQQKPVLLSRATDDQVVKARVLVAQAIKNVSKYNKERLANPARNQYTYYKASENGKGLLSNDRTPGPFIVSKDVAAAAALVAEADAYTSAKSQVPVKRNNTSGWWLGQGGHSGGRWPFGNNTADFKVYYFQT